MNKLGWLIILFLSCGVCEGQNLVPNPSFENYISCPTALGQVDSVSAWFQVTQSPDYFNTCAANSTSVPNNAVGYQPALSGNAYCGMICYYPGDLREYIGTHLTTSLAVNQKYFISFSLSLANNYYFMGCNKFGCKLSTVPFIYNSVLPDNQAKFYSDSIITDTLNWIFVKGSFIADSAYNYIAFGNFFDNANTDTLGIAPNAPYSYNYIDDVCVSSDSLTCYSPVGVNDIKNESEISLFPNPFSDKINITSKRNELVEINFYDITSRKIFNQSFTNSISINTSQLAKGIYIYEVRNNPDSYRDGVIKKGKLIKNPLN